MIRNLTSQGPQGPFLPCNPSDPMIASLAQDLLDTMRHLGLESLSAPAIGSALRMIVIESRDGALFILNPQITAREGAEHIYLTGLNIQGSKIGLEVRGDEARLIQHEVDNLECKL